MSTAESKPRCVYCAKPTRSHVLTIHPTRYAAALNDETLDADFGIYRAHVCHACWTERDLNDLDDLSESPEAIESEHGPEADEDEIVDLEPDEAVVKAITEMTHKHVSFDLTD